MAEVSIPVDSGLHLQDVALELASKRAAHSALTRGAIETCFREAKLFLEVAEEALTGGLDLSEPVHVLDHAFAPNLKKTHPLNLMSSEWGDLKKVKRVFDDLDANPAATTYEELGWGPSEVNQARTLFPSVLKRAKAETAAAGK